MNDDDFKRILKDRAYACTPDELGALLQKYGHDDECLALIKRGIYDRLNREDSGDWTSSASSGWKPANDKKKKLEQFILDRGPASMRSVAPAFNTAANADADKLMARITQLEARVAQLEKKESGNRFKLKA